MVNKVNSFVMGMSSHSFNSASACSTVVFVVVVILKPYLVWSTKLDIFSKEKLIIMY